MVLIVNDPRKKKKPLRVAQQSLSVNPVRSSQPLRVTGSRFSQSTQDNRTALKSLYRNNQITKDQFLEGWKNNSAPSKTLSVSRGAPRQIVNPAIGSASNTIGGLPGNVLNLVGNYIQRPAESIARGVIRINPINYSIKGINAVSPVDIPNPFDKVSDAVGGAANTIEDKIAPDSIERKVEDFGKRVRDIGDRQVAGVQRTIDQSRYTTTPQDGENRFLVNLGSGAGSLASSVALSRIPGLGTGASATAFGINAAGEQSRSAAEAGMNPAQALNLGLQAGVTEAALEKAGLDRFLGNFGADSAITGFIKNAATEGTQEILQSLAQAGFTAQYADVDWSDAISQAAMEGLYGAILGGGSTAIGISTQRLIDGGVPPGAAQQITDSVKQKVQNLVRDEGGSIQLKSDPELSPRFQEKRFRVLSDYADYLTKQYRPSNADINQLIEDARAVGAELNIDLVNGTVEQKLERIDQAIDRMRNPRQGIVQRIGNRLNLGDTGSISLGNNPSADGTSQDKNNTRSDAQATPSQDSIEAYAELLREIDKEGEVIILPDNTRASSNSPFYREYYKRNKKPPTKADYLEEAERQIKNGQAPIEYRADAEMISLQEQGLAHQMPDGTIMQGPEHEGAVPGSTMRIKTDAEADEAIRIMRERVNGLGETSQQGIGAQKLQTANPQSATEAQGTSQSTIRVRQDNQSQNRKQVSVSSDGRIANIDEFINDQVAIQEQKPNSTVREKVEIAKRRWIDTLAPAEDNFRRAVKEGKLTQETLDDIIVANGKSLRSGTMANLNLVESGLVDLLYKMPKADYDNLGQVLIARQAKDLRAKGIETGRDADIDQQIIDKYESKYADEIAQFKEATEYVLDKTVEHGLISADLAQLLRETYPNYVPVDRVIAEVQEKGSFNSSQVASIGQQTVVQKIKGSDRAIRNPMESMIQKVQDMTRQGLKNDAAIMWVDALLETGDAKLATSKIKPDESTISLLRNGEKEIYIVDPQMEAAAKGLTKEQMNIVIETARKVSRVFKTGVTGLNLPFTATNIVRDQQTAFLNMQRGESEIFQAIPRTIFETVGHGKLYQEAVRQGAISTSFDLTKPDLKRTAANIRKKGDKLGTLSKIEDVVGRAEEYTRLQQYQATKEYWLKRGATESEARTKATIAAQQNSADFARAGDYGRILNAILPYTNAGIQGTRAYLRSATTNPGRYAIKSAATLVMPMIMIALWNHADDEREEILYDISEFERQSNFIIISPWAKKNEQGKWEGIVKIPKPPGISALMYPVEQGIGTMKGQDPVGFDDAVRAILGFGSPLGDNLQAAASTITPQAIKPLAEVAINRNIYTGRDIVPFYMQDKPKNEQVYGEGSGTAKGLAAITGQSPLVIEHLIRGYGGEVGLQLQNASDNALAAAGIIEDEEIGGRSIPYGFKRRFTEAYDQPDSDVKQTISIQDATEVAQQPVSLADRVQQLKDENDTSLETLVAENNLPESVNTYEKLAAHLSGSYDDFAEVYDWVEPRTDDGDEVEYVRYTEELRKDFVKVMDNELIPDTVKQEFLQKHGIPQEVSEYEMMVADSFQVRKALAREALRQGGIDGLLQLRQESYFGTGYMVANNSVINDLVDDGLLSKDEAKAIKDASYTPGGQLTLKSSGGGGSGGSRRSSNAAAKRAISIARQSLKDSSKLKLGKTPAIQIVASDPGIGDDFYKRMTS